MDEHQIQIQCYKWFQFAIENKGNGYMFATPNASKRTMAMASYMKAEGMRSGVADLVLNFKQGHTVYVELKTPDTYSINPRTGNKIKTAGGKQSETQKQFQTTVEALGFKYYLCDNLNDFMKICEEHKCNT